MEQEQRLDLVGVVSKYDSTPQGGLTIPAFVTRTGVFRYTKADGSVQRELRHPDDVFATDSLATLAGAPLTIGHPGAVTPANWRSVAIGHLSDTVRRDGKYVAARALVQDASAAADVRDKKLVELSCGYATTLVPGRGTYDGEEYDARQTNIRYNHVGMGPRGWGRAGGEVRLRVDSPYTDMDMTTPANPAPAPAAADPAPAAREDARPDPTSTLLATIEQLRKDNADLSAKLSAAEKARADAADPAVLESAVVARVKLHEDARRVLGADAVLPATEREILVAVATKVDPAFKPDLKTSLDLLRGRFDAAVVSRADSAHADVRGAVRQAGTAAAKVSRIDAARAGMLSRAGKNSDQVSTIVAAVVAALNGSK